MNHFSKLGLSAPMADLLDDLGFKEPTPIQKEAIPMLLENDPTDFIGLAQTGTGKTAAFGLPLLELIDADVSATQALIMAPTRELSQQIAQQLVDFAKAHKKVNIEVVFGGADIVKQIKALKKPTQIVVATPGRLQDLIKRKAIQLANIEYVILDEADEMLNMGFKEAIDAILAHTPEHRTTWLFSATMPGEIRRIVEKYMISPKEVSINTKEKSNKDITHQFVITKTANKIPALRRFLDQQPDMRGVMFCRTRRETQEIANELGQLGYGAEPLHGDMTQAQRDAVMRKFKNRAMQLLIATDVAARGIDVNDLTHVIHHKLPDQLESYTHRSGRTGRAGKKGISLAFINPREKRRIADLEKKINVKFDLVEVPNLDQLKSTRINHWADIILNTEVDEKSADLMQSVKTRFDHLSKEDLLQRLITSQLDHLAGQNKEEFDLNESHGKESTKRSGKQGLANRFFVNVGTIDGVTKGDLLHFLSDVSGLERNHFGEITLQKTCSFFDLDKSQDKGFTQKFEGIEVDGRAIRVNRDEEGRKEKRNKTTGSGRKNRNPRPQSRSKHRSNSRKNRRRKS